MIKLARCFVCLLFVVLLLTGCGSNPVDDNTVEEKSDETSELEDEKTPVFPMILDDEEKDAWISAHAGRYRCEENDSFTTGEGLGIDITLTPKVEENDHNIYQITCCINDGVIYDIDYISQENESTFALHLNRITIDNGLMQNVTIFPTNTYLVQVNQSDNDDLKLQFAGVYKDSLDSFNGDVENAEWLKNFPQFYKGKEEWYDFRRVDYYVDLDECQRIVDDCFTYYYQQDAKGYLDSNENAFLIWFVELTDGNYSGPVHFIQYKSDINKVYHDGDLIWDDGKPVGNKKDFRGGAPDLLEIMKGPIRMREDHNTDSEILGSVNSGEQYWYFDEYEDNIYVWYRIYVPKTNSYAWIASSKTELWIGKLA